MANTEYKVSPYRWVILLSIIPILAMVNVFWLTFAPITSIAVDFYNVSPLSIAFLSMSYMIVYIIMALPASYLIDTKGFKFSVTLGSIIIGTFGILRGLYSGSFAVVTISQIGVAIAQPFLVNSTTKVAARWFPVDERATASGIATMATYIGMVIALSLTPGLTEAYGIPKMLLIYGCASIICAAIFIIFAREKPATPPGPGEELVNTFNFKDALKLTSKSDFKYLMICMFIIMGIFNAVMTWIEDILKPRGISSSMAGIIGSVLVIVGLAGAVVLPAISDKKGKRKPLLVWPIIAAIPGFIGITFFSNPVLLAVSSAVMGFCIMGMGPVAFQYGAEIAYPVAEGTSFGLLMGIGQVSGIIFIYAMDILRSGKTGDMTASLVIFIILTAATVVFASKLHESNIVSGSTNAPSMEPDSKKVNDIKNLVCESGRRLLKSGLVSGTWGNISCRINDDYMAITPSGRDYDTLDASDIVIVNIHDLSYRGNIKPSSEKGLHAEIYKSRKEINAVVHTHSANACTVAASRREVPPILDDMAQIIGPSIKVADHAIPGTKKLIRGAIKALKGRNGALLANHGAVCLGRDMNEAFVACEVLDKACKAFIESEFLGGGVPINGVEARFMHEYYLKKYSKQRIS